jgi:FtsP/CotA-like multicopper oxidase with cupredoxin domain
MCVVCSISYSIKINRWAEFLSVSVHTPKVIGTGALYPWRISVDQHNLTMVAVDGFDITPVVAESFIITPGERYNFILDASQPYEVQSVEHTSHFCLQDKKDMGNLEQCIY